MSGPVQYANTVAAGMLPERLRFDFRSAVSGLGVVGMVLLALGVALAYTVWHSQRDAYFAEAYVVALQPERPSHVVVEYPDRSGKTVEGVLYEGADRESPIPGSTVAIAVHGPKPWIESRPWIRRDERPWNWARPAGLIAAAILMPVAALGFLRRHVRRQRDRHALLQRTAARMPATSVETAVVARGLGRWGVIATWRDRLGRAHRTLAAGFDYDPLSLLDVRKLAVLHDGGDPALAIVAPDTLPPCFRSALSRSDRDTVAAHAPVSIAYRIVMTLATLATLALLVVGVMRTMRW